MSSTSHEARSSPRRESRSPQPAGWWHRANLFLGLVLLGVVIVVARNLGEGVRFAALLREARPEMLLIGVAAQVLTYVCSSAIWYRIARRHSHRHLSFSTLVPLGFAKLFVDHVLPTAGIGGTLVVVRGLTRRGLSRPLATAAVLIDLVAFYAGQGLAVAAALAALLIDGSRSPWIIAAAVTFLVIAVVVPGAIFWVHHWGRRAVPRFVRKIAVVARFLETLAAAPRRVMRDWVLMLECTLWQLGVIVLDGVTLGAMLYAVGVRPSLATVVAAHALATAVASFGLVPAGLGVFEATSIATLRLLDVPMEAALAATLLARGLTLWIPLIPGLVLTRRETRHSASVHGGHAATKHPTHVPHPARHSP